MKTRQELYCTECTRYVQFDLELDGDGNYTIPCHNCKHEHYRRVIKGKVSEVRWRSSGGFMTITATACTRASTFTVYASVSSGITGTDTSFLYQSWMNRVTTG
jgi:hypothetical protein